MGKKKYKVDYHLICVIFFSDQIPKGADIAALWTSLSALGSSPAEISIKRHGEARVLELNNCKLGSPTLSEAFVADDQVDLVGASVVRPDAENAITDSDVNFGFKLDGIWDGKKAPATLDLSVSAQVIEELGTETIIAILRGFFEMADNYSPIYGLVDLARANDAYAGMVYSTAWPRTAPLARWVEHMSWMYSAAKKGDCLRGLYWGNYLGSKILDQLGGQQKFGEAFAKKARYHNGSPNAHCWKLPNGLFLSLCLDPLDCRPTNPTGLHVSAESNLKWLVRELGEKGVLNQW